MMLKILAILSILSIHVGGISPNDHEQKHAVSSQSFHRDDVPLSYKYTSVHVYTTPHPEQNIHREQVNPAYHIQYAPLSRNTYPQDIRQHITEQQHSTEEPKKDHLEPRVVAENIDAHDQHYRSYVPGHNIEVLQSKRFNDKYPYQTYHDNMLQQQKNVSPKLTVYRQPNQQLHFTIQGMKEHRPLSENNNVLYTYLPKQQYGQITNTQHVFQPVESSQTLHQALTGKAPRLHLNIARVYGIAHMPQQAPVHIEKPPSHTQAFFLPKIAPAQQKPQKTILYPVQDTNENYPTQIAQ